MENEAGPSSSSGSQRSVGFIFHKDNLNYFISKEHTLSHLCIEADQMTFERLAREKAEREAQSRANVSNSDVEQGKRDDLSVEKMVVGQDQDNEQKNLPMKSLGEIFKLNVDTSALISLYDFCQTEYGENADYMWKEKLGEVWQAKEQKLSASASAQEEPEDEAMETGKVSNEPICFKTNYINDSSSTDDSISLNINSCMNGKTQIDNKWENLSFIKYFVDEEEMEISREIPTSAGINNGTYQIHGSSVPSTNLKKPGGLSMASEYMTSTQNDGLIMKKNTNDISSVRDVALASSSSHDIEYIDADEDCFKSPMSQTTFYKTDSEDSKINKTLSSINKSRGNMIDLEDLLNTFTESTNLHIRNLGFDSVVPAKSSLKRKISQISNKKKVKMSELKFTSVTIFYFERSQGFSSIPTKGGSTLGMEHQHFYISTIPIDEYEHRKVQKQQSNLRSNSIIYHKKSDSREKPKNVQALTLSQRVELLESAEVQIEVKEEVDCAQIRSSRASAGCECKEYCDPDICCCSLSGIECQVDRPNFPCGCTRENCRNKMGRNEYNHSKVKTHFTKTMRKINLENKGRTSRRKQVSPTKVIMGNPNITRDINMIQI